ncbi:MAG: response regulator, partial [Quisquiliibacterium sp.]
IQGTGIGLTLSQRLIQIMGENLSVTSKPGRGTTFHFTLDQCEVPENQAHTARPDIANAARQEESLANNSGDSDATPEPNAADSGLKRAILYIEDTITNLEVVRLYLERQGAFHLLHAIDGRSGIALARDQRPEAIILDMNLPDMHGLEVKEALANNPETRDIPVIALSANAFSTDIEQALKAGFTSYLTKPIKLSKLLETLEQVRASA